MFEHASQFADRHPVVACVVACTAAAFLFFRNFNLNIGTINL